MLDSIALFKGMGQRMDHLAYRQRVISQNIMNADTPDYRAHRVEEPNFKKTMSRYMRGASISGTESKISAEKTNDKHMSEKMSVGRQPEGELAKETYEAAPSDNAVIIEEEMIKSSQTSGQYNLMINLYRRHQGMLNSALARSR